MEVLSVIVPCYNEEEALPVFSKELARVLDSMTVDYEILFIDDGSTDGTLAAMKEIVRENPKAKYFSFSRNFGKEAAMYAGFCNAGGDYVVVMDADMQDPPELLPEMLELIRSDECDSVATRRVDRRGEPPIRSFFARCFYRLINRISDANVVDGARDYRMMKKEMRDVIVSMSEYNRFSKGIYGWIGFKTSWLPYENVNRVAGESKWSFWGLLKYAIDGIINFSQTPLSIASWFGVFMTFISMILLVFIVVRKLVFGDPVDGWASTICIIIFSGGIQLFFEGIIGLYLSKNYMESKKRPHYIIADTNKEQAKKIG